LLILRARGASKSNASKRLDRSTLIDRQAANLVRMNECRTGMVRHAEDGWSWQAPCQSTPPAALAALCREGSPHRLPLQLLRQGPPVTPGRDPGVDFPLSLAQRLNWAQLFEVGQRPAQRAILG